jgi:hypothetical protein
MKGMRAATVVVGLAGLAGPVALTAALTVACGARSGLFLAGAGEGQPSGDGGAEPDAIVITHNGPDATAFEDVAPPGLDVAVRDVARPAVCADASDTLIYTVTTDKTGAGFQILRFDPSSATFALIGPLVCPDPYQPFSMAVDREGTAYVLYYDESQVSAGVPLPPGNIYRVNLNTAACEATSYVGNAAFQNFGMGFVANDVGTGETLYVATNNNVTTGGALGTIDETTLAVFELALFAPPVSQAELTGTGDGRLYAFWAPGGPASAGSAISEIDKKTAKVIGQSNLATVTQGGGWAFAFWGGSFYLFTNPAGLTGGSTETVVQRYDPTTGAVAQVATYPETVVGAGVSTCAPIE